MEFYEFGKFIERCLLTIDTADAHFKRIDYKLDVPQHIVSGEICLLSLSGYELYLKNYTRDQTTRM